MASQIDITKPVTGNPQTAAERANWTTAASEITALQAATTGHPFLSLGGGTMTGPMNLANDPTAPMNPVTLQFAQANFGAPGGGPAVPEAPNDGVLYGRQSAAWVHAASPADITAAINAKWTQATETALGVAMVATQALVNAGTDDLAFVTAKKLAARIAAAVGVYVPLTGSSTIVGSLTFAPTAAAASPSLVLTRPDANGTPSIVASQGATPLWEIDFGLPPNNNFQIVRQPGVASTIPFLIENSTGFARIGTSQSGAWITPANNSSNYTTTISGPITPANTGSDCFAMQARRLGAPDGSGNWNTGAQMRVFGPSHPSAPNSAQIVAGSTSQFLWGFGNDGGTTLPGVANIYGTTTMTRLQLVNANTTNRSVVGYTGPFGAGSARWEIVLGDATSETGGTAGSNFAIYCYNDAGAFLAAPFTIRRSNGYVTVTSGSLSVQTPTNNPQVALANSVGTNLGVLFSDTATNGFNMRQMTSNGQCQVDAGGNFVITGAPFSPSGGSWNALSDERIKTVEGEYVAGLAEVVQLRTVTYVYKGNDTPSGELADSFMPDAKADAAPYPASPHYHAATAGRRFVGLVAQELERIMPDLVSVGAGFIDGVAVADLRSMDPSPLVYALINAIKTLAARVTALEGTA